MSRRDEPSSQAKPSDPVCCAERSERNAYDDAEDYSKSAKGEYFLDEDYKYVEKFSREDLQDAFEAGKRAALMESGKERSIKEMHHFFNHGRASGIRWILWQHAWDGIWWWPQSVVPPLPEDPDLVFLRLLEEPGKELRWNQEAVAKMKFGAMRDLRIQVNQLKRRAKLWSGE